LAIKTVIARNVSSDLTLQSSQLHLGDFRADVFGGAMRGDWQGTFSSDPPTYGGTGHLDRAAMAQVAQLVSDGQTTGTFSATYKINLVGWSQAQLLSSSAGTVEFTWAGGSLPNAALDASGSSLQIKVLTAQGEWRNARLELTAGRMETPSGIYQITGTAGRQLDLKLRSGNTRAYLLSGTLDQPHVTAMSASETQASLKP
jgi:uncharacterized protein involved in outer membrane biogenesis